MNFDAGGDVHQEADVIRRGAGDISGHGFVERREGDGWVMEEHADRALGSCSSFLQSTKVASREGLTVQGQR